MYARMGSPNDGNAKGQRMESSGKFKIDLCIGRVRIEISTSTEHKYYNTSSKGTEHGHVW